MSQTDGKRQGSAEGQLADLVASSETGARSPAGAVGKLLAGVALFWSLFQLWIASPLPFMVANWIPVLNNTKSRSIHLALAIFLAYTAYPALKRSPRDRIPIQDWVFALVGAFCAGYIFLFYVELSGRPGQPTTVDLIVSGVGMVLLLEATRRALGPPLMVVALV
ncbi:MAG TPA: C4-dicarboxylate ABC transporter, partial [Kiloniellales bacterium]